jgi:hypothetical protein
MSAYGLVSHPFFEDLLVQQAGFEADEVERPYTTFQLMDPHVQAFRLNLDDVAAQLHKREESRRMWEDIKKAAAAQGVSPGEVCVGRGLHMNKNQVSTFDPLFEEKKAMSGKERDEEIIDQQNRVAANNAELQSMLEKRLRRPNTLTETLAQKTANAAEIVGFNHGRSSGFAADAGGFMTRKVLEYIVNAMAER